MQNKNNNTNFWISYADLMAGLLFVFILLIGAIIVKYSLLQSESKLLEENLHKEKLALEKNKEELERNKQELNKKEEKIKNVLTDLSSLEIKYKKTKEDLKESLILNEEYKTQLKNKDELLAESQKNIDTLKDNINETKSKLEISLKEKEQLALSYEELKEISKQKDEKLDKLLEEVLAKKSLIESFEDKTKTLNDEIALMTQKLKNSEKLHDELSSQLQNTKEKIKSFTGIKVKVITLLKKSLGEKIQIDPKNGSLRLSSKVLFDEGEYVLKEDSKSALKSALYDYFQTILDNNEINKHIDKIVIEGHTNSKGTYLYNLELSQKRAFSVMDFLLSLDFNNHENLKELILASGRSFLDPIYTEDGKEDSDASRRIEIKLRLKNEEAIKEIGKLLQ
jgi:chemotaxis protein MotB